MDNQPWQWSVVYGTRGNAAQVSRGVSDNGSDENAVGIVETP